MPRSNGVQLESVSWSCRSNSRKMSDWAKFVYEDIFSWVLFNPMCINIKVVTNQAEMNSLPFH